MRILLMVAGSAVGAAAGVGLALALGRRLEIMRETVDATLAVAIMLVLVAAVVLLGGCTERGDNNNRGVIVDGESNTVILSADEWAVEDCWVERLIYNSRHGGVRRVLVCKPPEKDPGRWLVALNGSDSHGAGAADLVDPVMTWSAQRQFALRVAQETGHIVVCPDGGSVPPERIQSDQWIQVDWDLEGVEVARDVYGLEGDPLVAGHSWGGNRALDLGLELNGPVYASSVQLERYEHGPAFLDRDYPFVLCQLRERLRTSYGTPESGEYIHHEREWATQCGATYHEHDQGHRLDLADLLIWVGNGGK